MLVRISKVTLLNALHHVLRAVSPNRAIPILSGLYIHVNRNEIGFTASNTSLSIQYTVSQDHQSMIYKTGSIVVPARYFNEVIRKLNTDVITLEVKEHLILTVTSGYSKTRLCGMDAEEFPNISHRENGHSINFRIKNAVLKSSIKQVAIFASTSEMRPVLTGVSFDYNDGSLSLLASDGIRLASKTIHIGNITPNTLSTKIIVPAQNLYEVSKMMRSDDGTIEIDVGENQISFRSDELQVKSVLISGAFPAISNVIPQSYSAELLVDTSRLLHAVECVSVLAGESIIRLTATKGSLELSSRTAEIGDIQDEVPLLQMIGEVFSLSLNGKFLMDIIRSIDSQLVKLRFTGKDSPVVIVPEEQVSSTLFLITPVRTRH